MTEEPKAAPVIPALQPTKSSNIQGIGFHDGALYLRFGSKVYRYTGPKVAQHHADLVAAESMGVHFAKNVRRCSETTCELVGNVEPEAPPVGTNGGW